MSDYSIIVTGDTLPFTILNKIGRLRGCHCDHHVLTTLLHFLIK